jgi:hypothetical protein
MKAASQRHPIRVPRHTSIGVVVLLGLGALAACVSDGVATGATPPSGITGVGGGTAGGGGSSGGGSTPGLYTLVSVNDTVPPVLMFYDSSTGTDTTAVFAGTLDSSFISLNTDGSATEWDYLSAYELRESSRPGDSSFSRTVSVFDSTAGTYTVSGSVLTLTREDTMGTFVTMFTIKTGTLTGEVPYTIDNSYGFPISGTVSLVYNRTGSPRSGVQGKHPVNAAAAEPRSRIRLAFGRQGISGSALRTRSP